MDITMEFIGNGEGVPDDPAHWTTTSSTCATTATAPQEGQGQQHGMPPNDNQMTSGNTKTMLVGSRATATVKKGTPVMPPGTSLKQRHQKQHQQPHTYFPNSSLSCPNSNMPLSSIILGDHASQYQQIPNHSHWGPHHHQSVVNNDTRVINLASLPPPSNVSLQNTTGAANYDTPQTHILNQHLTFESIPKSLNQFPGQNQCFPEAASTSTLPIGGLFSGTRLPESEKTTGDFMRVDNHVSRNMHAPECGANLELKADEPLPQPPSKARPERRLSDLPKKSDTTHGKQKSVRFKKTNVDAPSKKKQRSKKTKRKIRGECDSGTRGGETDDVATPKDDDATPKDDDATPKPKRQRMAQDEEAVDQAISGDTEEESKLICSYDDKEYRYVNPLLEFPPLPGLRISNMPHDYYYNFMQSIGAGGSYHGEPMHASELWSLSQIYFPRPDTFPLRYLARLLGFELKYRQKHELRQGNIQGNDSTAIAVEVESNCILQLNPEAPNVCPIEKQFEISGCTSNESAEQGDESMSTDMETGNFDVLKDDCLSIDQMINHFLTEQIDVTRLSHAENDSAMRIPPLGSSFQNIAGKVIDVEIADPVWRDVKGHYQGYSDKYFRPLKVLPRGFPKYVFSDECECLRFAQEINLIPFLNDVIPSFRFANSKDEALLKNIICREKSDYQGFRQLRDENEVALKYPGDFAIIAFQNDQQQQEVPLGFIHYCFHWYTMQGSEAQSVNSQGQKGPVSEVMMYINEVCLFDNIKCEKDRIILEGLLSCHALEHARFCGIFYGMLHVSKGISSRYQELFRMTELPNKNGAESNTMSLLAFGLSKSNCQYTLRMLRDLSTSKASLNLPRPEEHSEKMAIRHRMIIKMPSKEAAACLSSTQASYPLGPSTRSERKPSSQPALSSSAKQSIREKSVVAQLDEAKKMIFYGDSSDQLRDEITDGDIPWTVLQSFSVSYEQPHVICEKSFDADSDDLLNELTQKQQQLMALENELEPRLRNLLGQVVGERIRYDSKSSCKMRATRDECLDRYNKVMERKKAAVLAWQMQQEQDMDAVCDICNDGEVSVNNQILFCESCNVAVHQNCYGIESVPVGDWFCRVCRFFNRHEIRRSRAESEGLVTKTLSEPLPICCELCPRKQGAFVRTENTQNPSVAKWVHVVCAKWQGLNYLDQQHPECVESVHEMKFYFRTMGISCFLCKGMRGAYHQCTVENCKRYMHMSCARSLGTCSVIHGETAEGMLDVADAWKLKCPEHSEVDIDDIPESSLSLEQLVEASKHFPPDPLPPPPKPSPKNFSKLTVKEREECLKENDFESDLLKELRRRKEGAICEICYKWDGSTKTPEDGVLVETGIFWCNSCGITVHKECYVADEQAQNAITRGNFICAACSYLQGNAKETEVAEIPNCNACNQRGGPLQKAFAIPVSMAKWNKDKKLYKRSMFGRQIWCHSLCGIWCPQISIDNGDFNCTMAIMSNGLTHINEKWTCALCCRRDKMKVKCSEDHCRYRGSKAPYRFHVSCARQAGFEVSDEMRHDGINFKTMCFEHMKSEYSLKALLEDFIAVEEMRVGKSLGKGKPMPLGHFVRLLQMAVKILAVLGWAWRWAEWWVEKGDRWEPCSIGGELGEVTSRREKVHSTPESRCADARRCRLAALGAALRNRDYDKEEGDDRSSLERALTAVLHTPSLVGLLSQVEIGFFVEWLSRAYRSKDRLLGFGGDKIPVSDYGETLHIADLSPKFFLGKRPLPGKQVLSKGEIFEADIVEVDDFLMPVEPNAEERGKKAKLTVKISSSEKKGKASNKPQRLSLRSTGSQPPDDVIRSEPALPGEAQGCEAIGDTGLEVTGTTDTVETVEEKETAAENNSLKSQKRDSLSEATMNKNFSSLSMPEEAPACNEIGGTRFESTDATKTTEAVNRKKTSAERESNKSQKKVLNPKAFNDSSNIQSEPALTEEPQTCDANMDTSLEVMGTAEATTTEATTKVETTAGRQSKKNRKNVKQSGALNKKKAPKHVKGDAVNSTKITQFLTAVQKKPDSAVMETLGPAESLGPSELEDFSTESVVPLSSKKARGKRTNSDDEEWNSPSQKGKKRKRRSTEAAGKSSKKIKAKKNNKDGNLSESEEEEWKTSPERVSSRGKEKGVAPVWDSENVSPPSNRARGRQPEQGCKKSKPKSPRNASHNASVESIVAKVDSNEAVLLNGETQSNSAAISDLQPSKESEISLKQNDDTPQRTLKQKLDSSGVPRKIKSRLTKKQN